MKKIIAIILTIFMVCGVVFASGSSESKTAEKNTLTIGLVSSLADVTGRLHQDVINLFIDKWNKEGTLNGATVKLVAYDNLNNGAQDTEMSIKSVQKLLNSDHAQIIIPGQMSNIIQAVGDLINENEVVGIGLGLASTWMEKGWDYIYRTALNNNFQTPSVTETMNNLNQKRIGVLYQNTDNCLSFRDSIRDNAKKAGISIVAEEMLSDGGTGILGAGITGPITSVVNSKPDTIFVTVMGGNFGTVIKQIRQAGYKGMIYIGQILTTTEVESIGDEEVNGVVMCSPYVSYSKVEDCKNDFIRSCLQEFYDKYGYCPVDDQFYKMWDAMLLIENAVKVAGSTDPKKIQQVISSLKIEGTAGTMDFTRGSNECYYGARAWVYTGQGAGGAPVALEDWVNTDLAKKIVITTSK